LGRNWSPSSLRRGIHWNPRVIRGARMRTAAKEPSRSRGGGTL